MSKQNIRSTDASSTDAAVRHAPENEIPLSVPSNAQAGAGPAEADPSGGATRIGWIDGHMPELVAPLEPRHPETAFTETRRLRHDGWTPEKMRLFHERFAECGVVREACHAAGMSARAAYNLRDRDPLFAAGWEAVAVKARTRLADEAYSRSVNGVVERIYRDGLIVAERHRYDNRLTMSVLARLDARIDRAEERGSPHLALVARWDEYLAALGEGRREEGMRLLGPPAGPAQIAGDREHHELHGGGAAQQDGDPIDDDPHLVWQQGGFWWTDYPPPPGFEGDERGSYGDPGYRRALSPEEEAVVERDEARDLAVAEAQRAAHFSLDEDEEESGEDGEEDVGEDGGD